MTQITSGQSSREEAQQTELPDLYQREQQSSSLNQEEVLDLFLIALADRHGMLLVGPEGRAESGLSQLYRRLVDCSAAFWLISTRDVVLGLKTNSGIRCHLVRLGWRQVALTHISTKDFQTSPHSDEGQSLFLGGRNPYMSSAVKRLL